MDFIFRNWQLFEIVFVNGIKFLNSNASENYVIVYSETLASAVS